MTALTHRTRRTPRAFARALPAALLAAALVACFTEVGNPGDEPAMSAETRIDPQYDSTFPGAPDSVSVDAMTLRVVNATWYAEDSASDTTGRLWEDLAADFAAGGALPRRDLPAPVESLWVTFAVPPIHDSSATWAGFSDGYLRGSYLLGGSRRRFVFALPDTATFRLAYGQKALEAWRSGNLYRCRFAFEARRWLAVAGLDSARPEPGKDFVLFDAAHNAALRDSLAARFFHAFNGPRNYPAKETP